MVPIGQESPCGFTAEWPFRSAMLTVPHIPQYGDEPESWDRFFDKAAKGSYEAGDILSYANMAYMASLTGNPVAPDTFDLREYDRLFRSYFAGLERPATPDELLSQMQPQVGWPRLWKSLAPRRSIDEYTALWAKKRTVPVVELASDAFILAHQAWSADWLSSTIDQELDSLNYNSAKVVAAMILLAATWKSA
jgi:hypothetical protein